MQKTSSPRRWHEALASIFVKGIPQPTNQHQNFKFWHPGFPAFLFRGSYEDPWATDGWVGRLHLSIIDLGSTWSSLCFLKSKLQILGRLRGRGAQCGWKVYIYIDDFGKVWGVCVERISCFSFFCVYFCFGGRVLDVERRKIGVFVVCIPFFDTNNAFHIPFTAFLVN